MDYNAGVMKIVIAPDSFKGSVSAQGACAAMARGVGRVVPDAQIVSIPMADGGEGTVDALVSSTDGEIRVAKVRGPLGEEVSARYGLLPGGAAVIEMAASSGLPLVSPEYRNPLLASTYGLGQLILEAVDAGCRKLLIGIGGSATNDCGCGMAQALGVRFLDGQGQPLAAALAGGTIGDIKSVDMDGLSASVRGCEVLVACDVRNPLLGPDGATHVYGPQKGADEAMLQQLETNMEGVIEVIETAVGQSVRDVPGAGAAGGLGAGLMAFLGAKLERGVEIVMRQCRFAEQIAGADVLITGEGRIDATTAAGKTLSGVAGVARDQSIPVVALAGSLGQGAELVYDIGIDAVVPICSGPMTLPEAMQNAEALLADAAERALRLMRIIS